MHQLYTLQSVGSAPWHKVRLNEVARADLLGWSLVVPRWDGFSVVWDVASTVSDCMIVSDASGSWGVGVLAPSLDLGEMVAATRGDFNIGQGADAGGDGCSLVGEVLEREGCPVPG
uniref:Uncharacterized protein n=1 Tax=Amphimedon queenslandica TaxID=400682 RepID=A0A1X7VLC0_AMPQE